MTEEVYLVRYIIASLEENGEFMMTLWTKSIYCMNLDTQINHDDRVQDRFLQSRIQSAPMIGIVRTEQATCQRNALVSYPLCANQTNPLWCKILPFKAPYWIRLRLSAPRMKPISAVYPKLLTQSVIVCKPRGICLPPNSESGHLFNHTVWVFSSLHLPEPSPPTCLKPLNT